VNCDGTKPRFWLSRLMAACWAGHLPIITFWAPDSLSARALERTGSTGTIVLALLLAIAIGGVFDVIVSDIFPGRFDLAIRRHRHVGFMAMAILLVMLAFAIVSTGQYLPAVLSYLLAAGFAAWVAALDLRARLTHLRRRPA
jgi:hypothetical protein